jgi:hypothetical protein
MEEKNSESGSEKMQRIKKEAAGVFWSHIEDYGGQFNCEYGHLHRSSDSYAVGTMAALMKHDPGIVLEQMILILEDDGDIPNAAKDLREVYREHFSSTPLEKDTLHYGEE